VAPVFCRDFPALLASDKLCLSAGRAKELCSASYIGYRSFARAAFCFCHLVRLLMISE